MASLLPQMSAAIIGASAALVVAALTAAFNADRSHEERIWTRKAQAYSTILGALAELDRLFGAWFYDVVRHRPDDEERSTELRAAYQAAVAQLRRTTGSELWLLPLKVSQELSSLIEDLEEKEHDSWFEEIEAGIGAVANAKLSISAIARWELERPAWWNVGARIQRSLGRGKQG
ncbi:hypothetical protein [Phenylobacterium sp.]|uniref:hypothetical protein n=1 Tax=Phenylobacterium sp. TaxID=1871053 RepID=UPI0025EAB14D|nr:hypothetical protein [Phenylobacterium sp.]